MARLLAQRELRNNNTQVIDAVVAGESFIVTRNGERVAELHSISPARRAFIARGEIATLAARGRRIDRHRFRADLDSVIDESM